MKKLVFTVSIMVLVCGLFFGNLPTASAAGTSVSGDLKLYGHMEENEGISYYKYDDSSLLELGESANEKSGFEISANSIPSKYTNWKSRNTSVKDQTDTEICWAYATMAALESNLITKGITGTGIDLWEHHLAYFTYHGSDSHAKSRYGGGDSFKSGKTAWHAAGGNYLQAAATLSRGYGAIGHGQAASPKAGLPSSMRTSRSYGITDMVMLPDPHNYKKNTLNTTAMNQIKRSILKNGSCTAQLYVNDDTARVKYYYRNAGKANHGITVVGWDDTIRPSAFSPHQPSKPGAWIIKNSWGEKVHQNGYCYVSYYTPSMAGFASFIGDKASQINSGSYDVYQYDGVGVGDSLASVPRKTAAANIFKARRDALVSHVGTWTGEGSQKVNIKIYVGRSSSVRPTSGTKVYTKTTTVSGAGYHRINLGKTIGVPKGEKFSIVVTSKGKRGYFFPVEMKMIDNYSRRSDINLGKMTKGESYYYYNGKWYDIVKAPILMRDYQITIRSGNALAKAFTKRSGVTGQRISGPGKKLIRRGRTVSLKMKRLAGNGKLVYRSSNNRVLKVAPNGKIKGLRRGKAKVYVQALPTSTHRSAKKAVTVYVR